MEARPTQKQKFKNVYEIQGVQTVKGMQVNCGIRKDYMRQKSPTSKDKGSLVAVSSLIEQLNRTFVEA